MFDDQNNRNLSKDQGNAKKQPMSLLNEKEVLILPGGLEIPVYGTFLEQEANGAWTRTKRTLPPLAECGNPYRIHEYIVGYITRCMSMKGTEHLPRIFKFGDETFKLPPIYDTRATDYFLCGVCTEINCKRADMRRRTLGIWAYPIY